MRPCDVLVARIAARQHTMVSLAQLREAGITDDGVRSRVRAAKLHLVRRGIYSTVAPAHRPVLADEAAAILATGPGAVLSHRSAAALWGLTKRDPRTVDVIVRSQKRNRPGIRVHRNNDLRPEHVRTRHNLPLTDPYRSILDLAPLMSERETERLVSEALSQRLISDDQAAEIVEEPRITRSEAERLFLDLVRKAGLPRPRTNVRVAGYEVDAFWPDHDLVVEIDGFQFHGHRQAFEQDRRKGLALASAGVRVLRISWRQLVDEPELVIASLAAALASSAAA